MRFTLDRIKKEVIRLDKTIDPNSEAFKTAVILLSSAVVGPNVKKIAKFSKLPRPLISEKAKNLRKGGVWVKDKLAVEWFDENGGIAFWADCLVADGLLERK